MTFASGSRRAAERCALDRYLEAIGSFPLLTPGEEQDLAARVGTGCAESAYRLICCNPRFVASVASRYRSWGVSLADLINEGNLGLIRAVDRFDERRGVSFASYAAWWIRHAIVRALSEQSGSVRPVVDLGAPATGAGSSVPARTRRTPRIGSPAWAATRRLHSGRSPRGRPPRRAR